MFIEAKPVIKSLVPVIFAVFAVGAIVFAWTEPSQAPPGGNAPAPLRSAVSLFSQDQLPSLFLLAGTSYPWTTIGSKTLSNVATSTLLFIDATSRGSLYYNNTPNGIWTILSGKIRITVNDQELGVCYAYSQETTWDFQNCSISTSLLTPSQGNYIIKLQGTKLNEDHQVSFDYNNLRIVGLPYNP